MMLNISTNRELLERLIVAELVAKPGEGPLARRYYPKGGRGPASGVRSIGGRAGEPVEGRPVPPPPPSARATQRLADASEPRAPSALSPDAESDAEKPG